MTRPATSTPYRNWPETEARRHRTHRGKTYEHARFVDFIMAEPMEGCGWSLDKVEALLNLHQRCGNRGGLRAVTTQR